MVFDHFESSNIIGTDENLTGSISKNLDVHEYQVYNINHKYTIELPCETEVKSDFKPQIVKGANSSWTKGLNKGLEFKSNADYSGFLSVIVDGKEIDSSCYKKKAGSIIITLKPDYLKTLSLGSHYVIIKSLQGEALTNFIIKETKVENNKLNNESRENNPIFFKTSDSTNLGLWIALSTVSGFAFLFLIISSKIKSGKNSI